MKSFKGQGVSAGFAIGPALIVKVHNFKLSGAAALSVEAESLLFKTALEKAEADLLRMKQDAEKQNKQQSTEILEAHLMLLSDPEAADQTHEKIKAGASAEAAYHSVIEEFRQMFLSVPDELIRQRAVDLQDISERVLFYIQNKNMKFPDLELQQPAVVIARDLTPSQILSMNRLHLLGMVTVEGGSTSHTAILARSLEVPAVMGAPEDILTVQEGTEICLNGESGQILAGADNSSKESFLIQKKALEEKIREHAKLKGFESITADGVKITLAANIAGPQDLESFNKNDAEAVGLYRTEFLFLDRNSAPSEEEQFKVYKQVFDGVNGKHILVRTLDIGGDKEAAYLNMKPEENPFLGVRALRLCFQRPEIFKTQLRALLRAGTKANWGLMFPMVSQLEELLQAKKIIEEVKADLTKENKEFSRNFQTGIMIEIPSAAWMMDVLAPYVDFVSLGTNDLLQYTCAADRLNPELKSVYNPFNIGFLRQVHHVLKTCKEKNVHAGICGSLSHHPQLMAFFVGCGVSELSMTSQHILPARASLKKLNYKECADLVSQVLKCSTSAEAKEKFK